MVESRIALIVQIYIAESSKFPLLTLEAGYPSMSSIQTHFQEVPMLLEASELTESLTDTPHGDVLEQTIRFRVGRDANFYELWKNKRCIAALELANGERLLIGSQNYPLRYVYTRPIGAQQTTESDSTLTFTTIVPVA